MDNRPIGIFDSGIGGLTVVKEVMDLLPNENIVYFGDTARVPYGTKSRAVVTKYAFQCINFLLEKDVKAIVIACNTASAASLGDAQAAYDMPIIGVVEPGALTVCKQTKTKEIAIIGTEGTVGSGAYEQAINQIDNTVRIFLKACPMFVPIAEEGWQNTDIARLTTERYLGSLLRENIDALVMACTHYPLLEKTIQGVVGNKIKLINPAYETARALQAMLGKEDLKAIEQKGTCQYFVSDNPSKFKKVGESFLQKPIIKVEKIEIERYEI